MFMEANFMYEKLQLNIIFCKLTFRAMHYYTYIVSINCFLPCDIRSILEYYESLKPDIKDYLFSFNFRNTVETITETYRKKG